jgi:hypothetical protein
MTLCWKWLERQSWELIWDLFLMAPTPFQTPSNAGNAGAFTENNMYGKIFESTFTGSMYGAGPVVFALWSYVIAHADQDHQVEINPRMLAPCLGTTVDEVEAALAVLVGPDPRSRTPDHAGARMIHVSAFVYHVVNHEKYRSIRNEDERRAYNRDAQRKHRLSVSKRESMTVNEMSALSAQAEAGKQKQESRGTTQDAPAASARAPSPAENQSDLLTAGPAATALPTGTDEDVWANRIGIETWARAIKTAGGKIGPRNWRQWKAIVEAHSLEVVIKAIPSVKPTDRWPDQVEQQIKTMGCQVGELSKAIEHKIIRMVL